jgi:hypothetical protein
MNRRIANRSRADELVRDAIMLVAAVATFLLMLQRIS